MSQEVATLLPTGYYLENLSSPSVSDVILDEDNIVPFSSQESDDLPSSQQSSISQTFDLGDMQFMDTEEIITTDGSSSNESKCSDFAVPFVPTIPRSNTPFEVDLSEKMNPVTPEKPISGESVDPLTPTANLKMLMSAISPELRNREKLKEMSRQDSEEEAASHFSRARWLKEDRPVPKFDLDDGEESPEAADSKCYQTGGSRKEKSLGLLCQKFLAKYPEYPGPFDNIEVCLDEIAKELAVERRRIYDIVNVLESVEMVSRLAKNKYTWHGKTNLQHTLGKLKALGHAEGFAEQIERIQKMDKLDIVNVKPEDCLSSRKRPPLQFIDDVNNLGMPQDKYQCIKDTIRKDKSLGIMSQRFLMLFLVAKSNVINLDTSARILIGDPNVDRTENGKFKTKIRRLYDIANILTSLDLVRKIQVRESRTRKPAFKYVGPQVEEVKDTPACSQDGCHRPTSKHSLLDCVQNPQVCSALNVATNKPDNKRPSLLIHHKSFDSSVARRVGQLKQENSQAKKSFTRHSSFELVCAVAEHERSKLYASGSRPSSPFATCASSNHPEVLQGAMQPTVADKRSMQPPKQSAPQLVADSSLKHFVVIREAKPCEGKNTIVCSNSQGQKQSKNPIAVSVHKIPVQNISIASGCQGKEGRAMADQFVVRARPQVANKTQTVVKLTKEQIDTMMKALGSSGCYQQIPAFSGPEYKTVVTSSPSSQSQTMTYIVGQPQNGKVTVISTPSDLSLAKNMSPPAQTGTKSLLKPVQKSGHKVKIVKVVQSAQSQQMNSLPRNSSTQNTKRSMKNLFESEAPAVKKLKLDGPEPSISGSQETSPVPLPMSHPDVEVAKITQKAIERPLKVCSNSARPSPLRALHQHPEFQSQSHSTQLPVHKTPSPLITAPCVDFELALPLPADGTEHVPSERDLKTPNSPLTPVSSHTKFFPMSSTEAGQFSRSAAESCTPTLHLSSTSSPVMLLPARPASLSGQVYSGFAGERPAKIRDSRSRSLSPSVLTFGSKGKSSMQPVTLSPALIPSQLPAYKNITSPVEICGSPVRIVAAPMTPTDQIVPMTSIMNLKSQIESSPSDLKVFVPNISQVPVGMISPLSATKTRIHPMRNPLSQDVIQTQVMTPQSQMQQVAVERAVKPTEQMLTPTERCVPPPFSMTPTAKMTPVNAGRDPRLTPNTFFRSTPGGLIPVTSLSELNQTPSAFQCVSQPLAYPAEVFTAARRLTLQQVTQSF